MTLYAALTCGLFLGCASQRSTTTVLTDVPVETQEWRYGRTRGRELQTEHYKIRTTLDDPSLLDAVPQAIETAYAYYRTLVPSAAQPKKRMPVYLFARRNEWMHFTKQLAGPRAKTLLKVRNGGYMERGVTVIEYVVHQTTFPILAHEGMHQYLFYCVNRRIPAWLNEGLSVLCEGQRWGRAGLTEFDAWYNPSRRNRLADALLRDDLIPLERLLRINAGHVIGGTNQKIGTYYAQLWGLMLFLREGADGKYAASFERLLTQLGREDLEPFARAAFVGSQQKRYNYGTALFRAFISKDIDTVEQECRAFLRKRVLGEK